MAVGRQYIVGELLGPLSEWELIDVSKDGETIILSLNKSHRGD